MNPMLTTCPVCEGPLLVTRLVCPNCETAIEGNFQPAEHPRQTFSSNQMQALLPFSRLTVEQIQYLVTFIRCEGRFKRMEDELGLSYPTLRNRMNETLRAMGFEPVRDETPLPPSEDERRRILDELSSGAISAVEAALRLKGIASASPENK